MSWVVNQVSVGGAASLKITAARVKYLIQSALSSSMVKQRNRQGSLGKKTNPKPLGLTHD